MTATKFALSGAAPAVQAALFPEIAWLNGTALT